MQVHTSTGGEGNKPQRAKNESPQRCRLPGTFYSRSHLLGTDVIYAVKGHSESRNVLPVELRLAESCRFTPSGRGGDGFSVGRFGYPGAKQREEQKGKTVIGRETIVLAMIFPVVFLYPLI
ncbi:hypothetical protein M431DRAFT_265351 [Trichoderma harzianum CBS 226.95]|uniref:Uncharacterized protein n=1 Tax=Trichoderma harzianum CBS 226.95 TaxID=983964 RepID=A0A2T3ZY03_TRIHA|nr:hypothetical protein M431DRAFT_265351 [Trichoderma harzianum CBS 226.95]PTB49694.1 hypothetical protein M431DRAFT_265351 [Trichoderma harzianum CBS 226.95]